MNLQRDQDLKGNIAPGRENKYVVCFKGFIVDYISQYQLNLLFFVLKCGIKKISNLPNEVQHDFLSS